MKIASTLEPSSLQASTWSVLWVRVLTVFRAVRMERRERRLRLCESLPLGEKRSIAVVEFEQQRFLLAVTSANISLLTSLDAVKSADLQPHPMERA